MTIHLPEASSTNNEIGAVCCFTLAYKSLLKFMSSEMHAMFKMHYTFYLDVSCLWFLRLHNTTRISRPPMSNEDCYK